MTTNSGNRRKAIKIYELIASLALAICCLCAACASQSPGNKSPAVRLNTAAPDKTITSREILSSAKNMGTSVQVAFDPVYQRPKTFQAIPLKTLLSNIIHADHPAAGSAEIVFLCRDGYKAILTESEAMDGTGFLAYSDSPSSGDTKFSPAPTMHGLINPGPLYLIWTNDTEAAKPRPYQIEEIEIFLNGQSFALAEPSDNLMARKGFRIFRQTCASCHAINGAGGRVAVDLNIPMNVTEYWREPILRKLIPNAASVRANTKMPAFPNLTPNDIDALLAYLKDMKNRKALP